MNNGAVLRFWTEISKEGAWYLGLRNYAEQIIEEAHMDAAQGLHFTSEAQTHPAWKTISNVECACGCHTLLSQKTVDRGWTVIRGHKAAMPGVGRTSSLLGKPREHHASKVVSNTSIDSIIQFIDADITLVMKQLEDAFAQRTELDTLIRQLTTNKDKLERAKTAVKDL